MRTPKKTVLYFSVVAILASAAFASGASAHEWLTLSGMKLTKTEAANIDSSWSLRVPKIGSLFGGGELTALCDGEFIGTVGVGAQDTITLLTNLTGGEEDKLKCEISKSTNTICKTGTLVVVEPDNLPWDTRLMLTAGGTLEDDIIALEGGKLVGITITCSSVKSLCGTSLEVSKLKNNLATGGEFELTEAEKGSCTFGEGFFNGKEIVLGFLAN